MNKNSIEMLNGISLDKSVSHGTALMYDLFGAFADALKGTESIELFREQYPDYLTAERLSREQDDGSGWWDTTQAMELVMAMEDELDSYAPEGWYFGSHPGNDSDYGFWEHQQCSVWVGGVEVNDCYVTGGEAHKIAESYRSRGYDDVQVSYN